MQPIWFLPLLLIVPFLLRPVLLERRRQTKALREFARQKRLTFSPRDAIGISRKYAELDILQQGHSRSAVNLLYGTGKAGLITLFMYAYDLGFGVHRVRRRWWVAVIETPVLHERWRAAPAELVDAADHPYLLGDFRLSADRAATPGQLQACGVDALLKTTTEKYWWEVSGRLVAVALAVPHDSNVSLESLLETCSQMATLLKHPPGPGAS